MTLFGVLKTEAQKIDWKGVAVTVALSAASGVFTKWLYDQATKDE